jgi:hypothetical protein
VAAVGTPVGAAADRGGKDRRMAATDAVKGRT